MCKYNFFYGFILIDRYIVFGYSKYWFYIVVMIIGFEELVLMIDSSGSYKYVCCDYELKGD